MHAEIHLLRPTWCLASFSKSLDMAYPQGMTNHHGLISPQELACPQGGGYPQGKYESVKVQAVGPIDDSLGLRVDQLRESNRVCGQEYCDPCLSKTVPPYSAYNLRLYVDLRLTGLEMAPIRTHPYVYLPTCVHDTLSLCTRHAGVFARPISQD